ncbi:MAG: flagellar assembly protein FliH [Gammaproteobacteria bacterium]|nr:MAG: flagellar assembly protein FliH [Gammaproteobacteria bacterium]
MAKSGGGRKDTIKASDLTAYERWELPLIDESGREVVEDRQPEVKPLTLEDLEQIRLEAHNAGLEEGFEEGREKGYRTGYEQGLQEGNAVGLNQGLEQGKAQAYETTEREVKESLARLENLMAALLEPITRQADELEQALLNLVLAISRAVVLRELQMDSAQISRIVKEAIDLLPAARQCLQLYINQADYQAVLETVKSMDAEAALVLSEEVLPGGCRVETSHSIVDYTVDKRFQKTVQAMLENANRKPIDTDTPDSVDSMGDISDFHRELLLAPQVSPEPEPESAISSRPEPDANHEPNSL